MLIDCREHSDCELFIVEGKNAAYALKRVRSSRNQAILALQGKLPNAARAKSKERLLQNLQIIDLLSALNHDALGVQSDPMPFQKIIILTDPDADGVHARILVATFFYFHLRNVIEQGLLHVACAPLFCIRSDSLEAPRYVFSEKSVKQEASRLTAAGINDQQITRYKGLASLDAESLASECVKPESRTISQLSLTDCATLARAFEVSVNR